MAKRDQHTSFIESSNIFVPPYLPQYTDGVYLMDMPKSLHQRLLKFLEEYNQHRTYETFDDSYTVINHFENSPSLVYLDVDYRIKTDIALEEIRHLISWWSGVPEGELELTSFYGIRE